jgi:hypothetical protein
MTESTAIAGTYPDNVAERTAADPERGDSVVSLRQEIAALREQVEGLTLGLASAYDAAGLERPAVLAGSRRRRLQLVR